MVFEQFDVPGLSQYSYIIGCGGAVAVIDPKRDIDTYLEYAERNGLRIAYVLETHIHADFASGALALAEATGAELCLSAYDEGETYSYAFAHRKLQDGDELKLGKIKLRTLHTPGHTPEHISFLLTEPERSEHPLALFSGDFLFIGSVGRPDLLGEAEKLELAKKLYRSVQSLAALPDGTMIFPGHGAGSLCGAGMAQQDQSTLGYERASNPFLKPQTEQMFLETVLGSIPEFPDYYRRMKTLNAAGAPAFSQLPGGEQLAVQEFANKRKDANAVVLDLRRPEAFGGAHIPGSINIGAGQNLSMWAAWVLPYDQPILLVGDAETDLEAARRSLIRVGLDAAIGSLRGGIAAWLESGREQAQLPQVSVRELQTVLADSKAITVLDVRSPGEWKSGSYRRSHPRLRRRPAQASCGGARRQAAVCRLRQRLPVQHRGQRTGAPRSRAAYERQRRHERVEQAEPARGEAMRHHHGQARAEGGNDAARVCRAGVGRIPGCRVSRFARRIGGRRGHCAHAGPRPARRRALRHWSLSDLGDWDLLRSAGRASARRILQHADWALPRDCNYFGCNLRGHALHEHANQMDRNCVWLCAALLG